MKSDHIEGHSAFTPVHIISYTLRPILPASSYICLPQSDSMVLSGFNFVQWNTSPPPSASDLSTKLGVACRTSGHCCCLALDESQQWKLYWATLGDYLSLFARAFIQIRRRLLVASPSLLRCLPNLPCTFLHNHLHPLSPNPFGIIEIFHTQRRLASLQKICNNCLPVQGSFSQRFQTVPSPDNRPMLSLKKPCHLYFLPLVERT